jgi:hypothetical protein
MSELVLWPWDGWGELPAPVEEPAPRRESELDPVPRRDESVVVKRGRPLSRPRPE